MYRIVAFHRDTELCGNVVTTKVIYKWHNDPTRNAVQEVIDGCGADWPYWIGEWCGQKPPRSAMFAIWFELEWLDTTTGLWHTTFPIPDRMVNDEF